MSPAARPDVSLERGITWSRRTILMVLAFALTRALLMGLVLNPDAYPHGVSLAADRDALYRSWSAQVLVEHKLPYDETHIEYPPGAVPFLVLPGIFGTDLEEYRLSFALMMLIVDLLGFIACLRIASRWKSSAAPWLWIILVGILGPVAYSRFDLVPAMLTAWALERASYGHWGWAGGWMTAAGVAKVYPFLLLPLMFVASPKRKKLVLASAGVVAAVALPLLPLLGQVWTDVGKYHLTRGIHIESLWGSILFIASRQGLATQVEPGAGALHFTGGVADGLRLVCDIGVLAVMGAGIYVTAKLRRGDVRSLSWALLGTLSLAMVASPVLSPQFILWIVPFAVAATAAEYNRTVMITLIAVTAATIVIYPFLYQELFSGQPLPVILLWARNLALVAVGAWALRHAWGARLGRRAPTPSSTEGAEKT